VTDAECVALAEAAIDEVLPAPEERPEILSQAMRYAVGSGGKRIRPRICLYSALAAGGDPADARYPAAAIELLHNYTLVHDDLPAMDNDAERRGRPSVWAKFGEANAILAGDALLSLAFKVAAMAPRRVAEIVGALGERAVGVVRGQVEDLRLAAGLEGAADVDYVYRRKTSDLFVAAAEMGALAAGGSAADVAKLGEFALRLGLAFQYEDDLIDGDGPYSRERTAELAAEATRDALAALDGLPGDTSALRSLASSLVGRKL